MATDPTLHQALQYLASVCDGAVTEDHRGFNGTDTSFGKWLAAQAEWTDEQAVAAYAMARTYRGQLEGVGIDFDAIKAPADVNGDARQAAQNQRREANAAERLAASKTLTHDDDSDEFVLAFAYDGELVDAARSLPRRRYNGRDKTNRTPRSPEAAVALLAFAERYGPFTIDPVTKVDLDRLAAEAGETETAVTLSRNRIEFADGKAIAFFDYDRELVQAVKATGAKWNGSNKSWSFTLNAGNATKVAEFIDALPADRQVAAGVAERLAELTAEAEHRLKASRAEDADITIEGLGAELRPFQRAGVAYMKRTRRAFLGDDMGTGKTVQALALLQSEDAFPAIVVAPSSLKLMWKEHVEGPLPYAPDGWLPGKHAVTLSGRKPDVEQLRGADVIVLNWDILAHWEEALRAVRAKALIFDESHYGKDFRSLFTQKPGKKPPGSARGRAMLTLSESVRASDGLVVNASGTLILNRPIELAPQLEAIGRLDEFGGFFGYAKRYCGAYRGSHGWDFDGATNLEELNERLRSTCLIRRKKADVLPELPPKVIAHQHVEIDNKREYLAVEDDVIAFLREEAEREAEFEAELEGLSEEQAKARKRERAEDAATSAQRAEHLVQVNKLRQVIAKGKLASSVEWIKTFLDSSEEKLVVMAYHQEVQQGLLAALAEYKPAVIKGGGGDENKRAEGRFQADPDCRLIICSLRAGGVGLTLTAASNIALLEQDWTPTAMEQAEDRCHRIGSEIHDSVTCWYVMGRVPGSDEPTIDDDMRGLLAAKLAVTSTALDGEAAERNVSILSELEARLLARGAARQGALA